MFLDYILKIKPYKLVAERTEEDNAMMQTMLSVESKNNNLNQIFLLTNIKSLFLEKELELLTHTKYKDNINKLCVHCRYSICDGKEDEENR